MGKWEFTKLILNIKYDNIWRTLCSSKIAPLRILAPKSQKLTQNCYRYKRRNRAEVMTLKN